MLNSQPTPSQRQTLLRAAAARALAEIDRQRISGGRLRGFETDPVRFIQTILGEHPWSKQQEICRSVVENRRTAVKSAHEIGKSWLASRIISWWESAFPAGEAFAVTSATTGRQVRNILWREIRRAHRAGNLPGRLNQTEWLVDGEIVAFGHKPEDGDPTAFQGIHARRVLVVVDEGGGWPRRLWAAADSLIANDDSRFLVIGNPDDPTTEFAEICKPGSGWNVITVSAFDTPNFTGEVIPDDLRPLLVGKTWVEEKRRSWGEGSPLWQSKILGEFPEVSSDALIPIPWITAAINRELDPVGPNELGVDVARYGRNETVIYHRRGPVARLQKVARQRDLMTVSGLVIQAIRETGATRVKIDDGGLGGGVTDRLIEIKTEPGSEFADVEIVPVIVGERTTNDDAKRRFLRLKEEINWGLRDRFESGDIDLGDDLDTQAQLTAIKYRVRSDGRIEMESKDDMEKRLAKQDGILGESGSPDRYDALVLAFANPAPAAPEDLWSATHFFRSN